MASSNNGLLSPLQLEAGAGLLNDSGNAYGLASTFVAQINAYRATLVGSLHTTLSLQTSAGLQPSTVQSLQTIGASTIPALGDSVPTAYQNTNYPVVPSPVVYLIPTYNGNGMFSGQIANIGNSYLGNGDVGKLSQVFSAAQGYASLCNVFINSAINANSNNYLGPTYNQAASGLGNMDNLITGEITKLTLAFTVFGEDLAALGEAIDLANLEEFGTPAALLQQLANIANIDGTLPCVEVALLAAGLTAAEINDLVNNNRLSATNTTGLSDNQFNTLQKKAYAGLTNVAGDCLDQVLTVLGITTPNITQMSDLLDPAMIFPNSYLSLTFAGPNGPELIYSDQGDVNQILLNNGPSGCEELGKIIPPAQAIANRAIGSTWQQVKNISQVSLPELAAILV